MRKPFPITIAATLAMVLMLEAAPAEEMPRLITVTGSGSEIAIPDVALLTLGVETDANTAEAALAAMSERLQAIFAALDEAHLAEKDRQTSGLGLDPLYAQREDGGINDAEITGYRARSMLTLTLHDIDTVGALVDTLAGAGVNRIDGISFDLADPSEVVQQARRKAVADAMARATLYADAANIKLGPIVSISEPGGAMPKPYAVNAAPRADAAFAMPVARGSLNVDAEVTVVFEIGREETGAP